MKGGNCCNFETNGDNCTEGPYVTYNESGVVKNTKNIKQYCGVIDNIYVFFSFHAFKHMEELSLSCYDIEGLIRKINQDLKISYVAKSDSYDTATFRKEISNCNFRKKNIPGPDTTIFVSFALDPRIIVGVCNYYVFKKEQDDIIDIFVLGNCNYEIEEKTITYTPIYSFGTDDNVRPPLATATSIYSTINKKSIKDQYKGYKKTESLKAKSATAIRLQQTLTEPMRTGDTRIVMTDSTTKPSKTKKKKKSVPASELKSVPKSPQGTLDTTEVINKGYFKVYKITPANISRLERIMRNIENDETIESAVIEFTDCRFREIYDISSKVKIVTLINCVDIPKFEDNNIYELNIITGTAELNGNLKKWKLTTMRIISITNYISFPKALEGLHITELVIFNTIIQNMTCWEKWPIQSLSLYYTSYVCSPKLPPIPSLTTLTLYMNHKDEFLDLKSNGQITSCMILAHIKLNICSYLSTELKNRIKSSNAVLVDNLMKGNEGMTLKRARDLFHDISYKDLYATSDFQFSEGIIYGFSPTVLTADPSHLSGHKKKPDFYCDCFCTSNISEQQLEPVGQMISILFNDYSKIIEDASPHTSL